jgi:hypothetical protein
MSTESEKTVEYRPVNTKLMIIVHEKGKDAVTIVANTIPASAEQHIHQPEEESS